MNKMGKKGKRMPVVLGIAGALILGLAVLIGWYLYSNLHTDEALMRKVWQADFTEKQVTLEDGSVLNYGEGPDNGPSLLLIHGQTVAWEEYDKVLPELSESFHVYAVDCYGHGESSHDPSLYSAKANGEALAWFLDNVIGESSYVAGHSSGGILAAWLGANAPEMVKGLVLEDPPLFHVTPEEIQEGKGAFAWHDAYLVTHAFVDQREEQDFPLYYLKNSYLLTMFGGLKDKIVQTAEKTRSENPEKPIQLSWVPHTWLRMLLYMDDYDPAFGNAFYDGSWMEGIDQQELLQSIRCPVIYLKANTRFGKDGVLYAANTDADADKVMELLTDCERINISSGHNIHLEHPDIFVSALKQVSTTQ